jgi:hypothetical protein
MTPTGTRTRSSIPAGRSLWSSRSGQACAFRVSSYRHLTGPHPEERRASDASRRMATSVGRPSCRPSRNGSAGRLGFQESHVTSGRSSFIANQGRSTPAYHFSFSARMPTRQDPRRGAGTFVRRACLGQRRCAARFTQVIPIARPIHGQQTSCEGPSR